MFRHIAILLLSVTLLSAPVLAQTTIHSSNSGKKEWYFFHPNFGVMKTLGFSECMSLKRKFPEGECKFTHVERI